MNTFLDLCMRRQSCRHFSDRPVEREKLQNCIEAARLAPSGCNAQPWSFVVVREEKMCAQIAKCTQQLGLNAFSDQAKAMVVVLEEHARLINKLQDLFDSQHYAHGDVGGAALSICLEAADQGLSTCILGIYDDDKIKGLLDIPAEKRIRMVIAVGYAADETAEPAKKVRKPFDEVARFVE